MAVLATACGPTVPLEIGVRERSVDVLYGSAVDQEQFRPPEEPRPPGSDPHGSSSPGFILPPVRTAPPATESAASPPTVPSTQEPLPPAPACPEADPLTFPEAVPSVASQPPQEGVYRFRREGWVKSAPTAAALAKAEKVPLSEEIIREVANVEEIDPPGSFTYDVIQRESDLLTTTTYRYRAPVTNVLRHLVRGGLFIDRIVTEQAGLPGSVGAEPNVETFQPQPAIRIMDFPAAVQAEDPTQVNSGVDPLTGAFMRIAFTVKAQTRIDVCGTWISTWPVRVEAGSQFQRVGVRGFPIRGTFFVAPQLGALVVADDLQLGTDEAPGQQAYEDDQFFIQDSVATLNATTPEPVP